MNASEAQEVHELARAVDPQHDPISCWCCCADCDFDFEAIEVVDD